jgi:hypothetical protein
MIIGGFFLASAYSSAPEMIFLDISLKKDSSLLLRAIQLFTVASAGGF